MKKNKLAAIIVVFLIVAVAVFVALWWMRGQIDRALIGENIVARRVTVEGVKTENGYLAVPYNRDSDEYVFINVVVDWNKDGKFDSYDVGEKTQEEWIVRNMAARVLFAEGNTFGFGLPDMAVEEKNDFPLVAVLTKEKLDGWDGRELKNSAVQKITVAKVETDEVRPRFAPDPAGVGDTGSLLDLFLPKEAAAAGEIPNSPPDDHILRSALPDEMLAEKEEPRTPPKLNEFHGGVPDILQQPNECVPTATANSLLWMAEKYNFKNKMPADDAALLSELKTDFGWDAESGVKVKSKYLAGKSAFLNRHGIAVETHQVGHTFDPNILEKIAAELKKGQDIEISIEYGFWKADGTYERKGGHMVTVVGAHTEGEAQFLDIHDPVSPGPSLLDIYEVKGTRIVGYPYSGTTKAYIRYAFAESPASVTPSLTPEKPEEEVDLSGNDFSFTHKIGGSPCPTAIDAVKITSGKDGTGWKIVGAVPSWLSVSLRSGKTPSDLKLSFNCRLNEYVTQTLSGSIKIQGVDAKGELVGEAKEIKIKGQVNE